MKAKLFILLTLVTFSLNAQEMFYYYHGEKINLTVNKNRVNIIADNGFQKSLDSNFISQHFVVQRNENDASQKIIQLQFKITPTSSEYTTILDTLKQNLQVKYVFPFFERGDAEPIGTSDIFYVRLKETKDTVLLEEIAKQQNVQILRQVMFMPLWYALSVQNSGFSNAIDASNYFYETGYFESIDPAFMFNFKTNCTNDPAFQQNLLWGLKNTKYKQGIDIKACDAWTITRGAGVNVAVVDRGIYMPHRDLNTNMHHLSFDAQSGTSPSIFKNFDPPDYEHGTHVAGIISALKDNGLDVVGVAPECKIMGVSHIFYPSPTESEEYARGITWAWQNGADIINNSWGDGCDGTLKSDILEEAILDAMTKGRKRNGVPLGCVVVFAAGNNGGEYYPGNPKRLINYPAILTVGAINMHGMRWDGSSFGWELDVVAPGAGIYSTLPYNATSYKTGTSMAAPHVSGIAALMLSINPTLTRQEVCDIIESTAQKVTEATMPSGYKVTYNYTHNYPNGKWNNEMGYGLVDAYAAVQEAACRIVVSDFINQTVNTNQTVTGCNIHVQDVTVTNGAKLILDATYETTIDGPFEIESGSELEIN